MAEVFEELSGPARLIYDLARLSIMTALGVVESANFLFLQRLTGLTAGNLSSHLGKLEEAGLVAVEKSFVDNCPQTKGAIADEGSRAI